MSKEQCQTVCLVVVDLPLVHKLAKYLKERNDKAEIRKVLSSYVDAYPEGNRLELPNCFFSKMLRGAQVEMKIWYNQWSPTIEWFFDLGFKKKMFSFFNASLKKSCLQTFYLHYDDIRISRDRNYVLAPPEVAFLIKGERDALLKKLKKSGRRVRIWEIKLPKSIVATKPPRINSVILARGGDFSRFGNFRDNNKISSAGWSCYVVPVFSGYASLDSSSSMPLLRFY